MGKVADLKMLFQALIGQFGFGNISSFKATNITKRIPKYKDVKIKEIDLNDNVLYSGRYTGYSDEDLMEVIDTFLFVDDDRNYQEYLLLHRNREDLIHNGKLLHFKQIDQKLDLPPGTAKRLLISVAKRYNLVPAQQTENIIRFKVAPRHKNL